MAGQGAPASETELPKGGAGLPQTEPGCRKRGRPVRKGAACRRKSARAVNFRLRACDRTVHLNYLCIMGMASEAMPRRLKS